MRILGFLPEAHSLVSEVVVLKDEPSAAWPSEPTTPESAPGASRPATALTLSIGEMSSSPLLSELISVAAYPPSEYPTMITSRAAFLLPKNIRMT